MQRLQSGNTTVAFLFSLAATLVSLYVLTSLPADAGAIRIGMAAGGFLIFLALFATLVIHIVRTQNGSSHHSA